MKNQEFKVFTKNFKKYISEKRGKKNKDFNINEKDVYEKILELCNEVKYEDPEKIEKKENGYLWILYNPPIWFFFHAMRKGLADKFELNGILNDDTKVPIVKLFYKWIYDKNRENTADLFIESYKILEQTEKNFIAKVQLDDKIHELDECAEEMFCHGSKYYTDRNWIIYIHTEEKCTKNYHGQFHFGGNLILLGAVRKKRYHLRPNFMKK